MRGEQIYCEVRVKLITTRFGEIEVDEKKIITFPLGIPGFAELKRYVLIDYKDPIQWLHAVDDPEVAFIVVNPFIMFPSYSVDIRDDEELFLGIKKPTDVVVLTILNVTKNRITANLRGPLVLNSANYLAAQILIDDERYDFSAPLPALPSKS
ncbi:MAG TPA: flagellar assembly protein FliW [Dissulfurispiraceae bacterium]|nr:flagellar assembly protein FliW [Dissulfurispiraceae bacterium]